MCRSHSSGEPARRCPCTSADKRSAYERGRRAVDRAARAVEAETLGLDVEPEEATELAYAEEVKMLADDIAAVYFEQKKRRIYLGEDAEELDRVEAIYADDDLDVESRVNSVVRLGHLVSQRAEELAGITVDKILDSEERYWIEDAILYSKASEAHEELSASLRSKRNSRDEFASTHTDTETADYDNGLLAMREEVKVLYEAQREAANNVHRMGNHPKTEEQLDRLTSGYLAALSEIRPMGGDMQWNNAGKTPVVKMFDSAAQMYPSDWIDYSNQMLHPFARNLKTRAHYSHHYQKVVKRVAVDYTSMRQFDDSEPPEDTPTMTWTVADPEEAAKRYDVKEGRTIWVGQHWEVAERWTKRKAGSDEPKGVGWKKITWQGAEGELTGWRRKEKMKLHDETETVGAPEIITNLDPTSNSKRRNGFATAVHELSHRYEAMVPEVTAMESDFHTYRTTNRETGEQNPQIVISSMPGKNGTRIGVERGREGGYVSKYMGREYDFQDAFEILSCGMEALFGHNYGSLIGLGKSAKDDHMRSFVLGVLASAGRRYQG